MTNDSLQTSVRGSNPTNTDHYTRAWKLLWGDNILGCLVLVSFFCFTRLSTLDMIYSFDSKFDEMLFIKSVVIVFLAYFGFVAAKIVSLMLWRFWAWRMIRNEIRRFMADYTWGMYVFYVPAFAYLCSSSILAKSNWDPISYMDPINGGFGDVVYGYVLLGVFVSTFWIPLLVIQRFVVACYYIGSLFANTAADFDGDHMPTGAVSTPPTLRFIVNECVTRVRYQLFHWVAIYIFWITLAVLYMTFRTWMIKDSGYRNVFETGEGMAAMGGILIDGYVKVTLIVVSCLAWCICVRNLLIAMWQCRFLCNINATSDVKR